MKTVAELMDMIRSRDRSSVDGPSIDEQIAIDADITRALWELYNAAHDAADLRAHVGTVEEERDQARANRTSLLQELRNADERTAAVQKRATAFEAALLAVLKMREPQ